MTGGPVAFVDPTRLVKVVTMMLALHVSALLSLFVPTSQASVAARDVREAVRATFDPEGPYDDAAYFKDPRGVLANESSEVNPAEPLGARPGSVEAAVAVPPNDDCSNATVIPGNVINYNPPLLNTTGATIGLCESLESCESGGLGTSNSVWYSYTPDQDGKIAVDTIGSNYNTVLSVHDGCGYLGSGFTCVYPNELACSDDYFFGTTSRVEFDALGGQTYLIKVADYDTNSGAGILDFNLTYRPPNDVCAESTWIPGLGFAPPLLSVHNATVDACEADEACESGGVGVSNTVWYRYVPACDGYVSVNTNGSSYDTVLSIWSGGCSLLLPDLSCSAVLQVACDDDAGVGLNSQLLDVPVQGGVEYLIKVADYNMSQGGGYLDFHFLFDSANVPTATITSPASFDAACSSAVITGSVDSLSPPFDWTLDYRPVSTSQWASIVSGTSPVLNGVLATWNTSGLAEGFHELRLVARDACGATESDLATVWVDGSFSNVELRDPLGATPLGGNLVIDGSAWDESFTSYTLDYRSASGSTYSPVDPAMPTYATPVLDDPLTQAPWDTRLAGLADGDYVLRLQGTDACGHSDTRTVTVSLDNTAPVALISSPAPGDVAAGVVTIRGTASDAHLSNWSLEYTGGQQTSWFPIAQGLHLRHERRSRHLGHELARGGGIHAALDRRRIHVGGRSAVTYHRDGLGSRRSPVGARDREPEVTVVAPEGPRGQGAGFPAPYQSSPVLSSKLRWIARAMRGFGLLIRCRTLCHPPRADSYRTRRSVEALLDPTAVSSASASARLGSPRTLSRASPGKLQEHSGTRHRSGWTLCADRPGNGR